MPLSDVFRSNVKLVLKQKDMTQGDLAKLLNLDVSSICHMLRAKYEPTLDRVETVARALRVKPLKLLQRNGVR